MATSLLSLSMTGTLAGFVASITNTTNTSSSGSLIMAETYDQSAEAEPQGDAQAASTCVSTEGQVSTTNSAECTSIDMFGGNSEMIPGNPVVTNIRIHNTGTLTPSSFTLTPAGSCMASEVLADQHGSGVESMCDVVSVEIRSGDVELFSGPISELAAQGPLEIPTLPAAGDSVPFTITTVLAENVGNDYQGLGVSLPLTWAFAS